jgi:hypothetical protein
VFQVQPIPDEPLAPGEEPDLPRRMVCPTCVNVLGVEAPENVTEPFANSRLDRIVKLVQTTPVLCQNCKQSESERKCSTCQCFCCRPCWEQTHSAPIFAGHVGVPLRHSEMIALPKCPKHSLNDQEFFVTEKEEGVCQVCLLKGDHVGAAYAMVADVRTKRQEEIERKLEEVAVQRERVVQGRLDTLDVLAALDDNLVSSASAVAKNFAAIREALDRREKETLAALQALKDAKTRVLQGQVDAADVVLTQLDDGTRNVQLVLKHSNPLEVIYQTVVIGEHLNQIGNVQSTAPRTCAQCHQENAACHDPAVDASLPVVLSDRVPAVVAAYAAVPDAKLIEKGLTMTIPQATLEQRQVMKEVASAAGSEEEWGCVMM